MQPSDVFRFPWVLLVLAVNGNIDSLKRFVHQADEVGLSGSTVAADGSVSIGRDYRTFFEDLPLPKRELSYLFGVER
jgi:hypothetical protein